MTAIAVVDHGAGNLVSIARGLERAGADARVVTDPDDLTDVDGMVLPGVGSMAAVMDGIRSGGFVGPLTETAVPLLGICVGMQVLFDESEEDGARGLGLISGVVRRLEDAPRLPHIGWNDLELRVTDPLLTGIGDDPTVYFVHSFAPAPDDPDVLMASATYGRSFTAAVRRGSIAGVQFHPERSGRNGLRILSNFVRACREASRAA